MLLEHYVNTHTKQILTSSDAETQTDHTEETAIFIDSPVLASTPLQISVEVENRASASVSKRRRLSLESHDPEGADETATGVNESFIQMRPHVMTSFREDQTLSATESEDSDLEHSLLQPEND
ncbi:Hypothetical predicted protein, partial [Paramuricea clavata]